MTGARVAVVGIHGHGASHVRNVARLAEAGRAELVAVADPQGRGRSAPRACQVFSRLDELLAATEVDVVVICTPIQTHVPLAELAMRAGADVLLEKPPTASMAEFEHLSAVVAETGRAVRSGFQAQASEATLQLAAWSPRDSSARSAGSARWGSGCARPGTCSARGGPADGARRRRCRRRRGDESVRARGRGRSAAGRFDRCRPGRSIETELFRANPIESDDTSAVRITTSRGTPILIAVTLCADRSTSRPTVIVHGLEGARRTAYTSRRSRDRRRDNEVRARADLLENLLEHRRDPTVPLLRAVGRDGWVHARASRRCGPRRHPAVIAAELVRWEGEGTGAAARSFSTSRTGSTGPRTSWRCSASSGRHGRNQ